MKKIFAVMIALCQMMAVLSQEKNFTILGKVIDSATQQPLNGASAFCQNTTYGTTCNADGNFYMRLPNGGYDLVISYTGYDTRVLRISNTQPHTDTMIIALAQIDKTLAEVAVVATNEVADGLTKYGKFFFDNFIGTTPNAAECTIQNPEALRFFFTKNKKRHRLKVTAKEDLLISNKALGYVIRYQLDSFSYDYNSNISQYTGYPFFKEIGSSSDSADASSRDSIDTLSRESTSNSSGDSSSRSGNSMSQWKKNRARTYLGSRLHFMTSLYDSVVNEEGFLVEKMEGNTRSTKGTVIENLYDSTDYAVDSTNVVINWDGRYRVSYKSVLPDKKFLQEFKLPANTRMQVTLLDIAEGFVIEENGYFYEQYDVVNTGYWAWKKLAELLPNDYVFE